MALKSSILFCCRLVSLEAVASPRVPATSSVSCVSGAGSPSWVRFFAAELLPEDGSTIGQTKPVRGVYAGLCVRRMSSDFCSDCRDVSCNM